jgi:hypothetical protein
VNHFTTPEFWDLYRKLPEAIQKLADENYDLLKTDSRHPSLHFKQIRAYWSVRVGLHYRALAIKDSEFDLLWFWIGEDKEYERLVRSQ